MTAGRRGFGGENRAAAGRSKLRRTRFAPDKCQGRVGEAGIRRRESDGGGGGDSDLHRNGRNWELEKKNLPFRRTPESLREIPICIGMVKNDGGEAGEIPIYIGMVKNENDGRGNAEIVAAKMLGAGGVTFFWRMCGINWVGT